MGDAVGGWVYVGYGVTVGSAGNDGHGAPLDPGGHVGQTTAGATRAPVGLTVGVGLGASVGGGDGVGPAQAQSTATATRTGRCLRKTIGLHRRLPHHAPAPIAGIVLSSSISHGVKRTWAPNASPCVRVVPDAHVQGIGTSKPRRFALRASTSCWLVMIEPWMASRLGPGPRVDPTRMTWYS